MDYDLHRLGWREFEHMVQALAFERLRSVEVFGDGPDGGREATFVGPIDSTSGEESRVREGVLQAKYRVEQTAPDLNLKWLMRQIDLELGAWRPKDSSKRYRERIPKQFLLVTNVRLSPFPGAGIDAANEYLRKEALKLGVVETAIWHSDTICRLLDAYPSIRQTYGGFVTSGDVLESIKALLAGKFPIPFSSHLRTHTASELMSKQWVRLGESGFEGNQKVLLGQAAMDLPSIASMTEDQSDEVNALSAIIDLGNRSLRNTEHDGAHSSVVVTGGPGQGKSTLAQLICQLYRVALLDLEHGKSLGPEADAAYRVLRECFDRLGTTPVTNRRWPVYVELPAFADFLASGGGGLLEYITSLAKVDGALVEPSHLGEWLRSWPWVVVLDGLDEVSSAVARDLVMRAISNFTVQVHENNCDVLLVATTRPQGYQGEFSGFHPLHLKLRPLEPEESTAYAFRLLDVRHHADPELITELRSRFEAAVKEPATARLVRSPLQATIMTFLIERKRRAPQSRNELFTLYYDTIYSRESNRPSELGSLLSKYREDIDHIHEQMALLLQIRSESNQESEAVIDVSVLEFLIAERLRDAGHDEASIQALAEQLLRAATDRVVLLAGVRHGQMGFEVRSLQEYLAARALVNGTPTEVLSRLAPIGPSTHWRNVWLLAAGRIFATTPHMRDGLMTVLRSLDFEPHPAARIVGFGERLALDLLEDDVATAHPTYQRMLIAHSLEMIDRWPGPDHSRLASTLSLLDFKIDRASSDHLSNKLNSAAANTTGRSRLSSYAILEVLSAGSTGWALIASDLVAKYFSTEIGIHMMDDAPYPKNQRPMNLGEVFVSRVDRDSLDSDDCVDFDYLVELLVGKKYQWAHTLETAIPAAVGISVPVQEAAPFISGLSVHLKELLAIALDSFVEEEVLAASWFRQLMVTIEERATAGTSTPILGALTLGARTHVLDDS
jgi:hypothetical protein